NKKLYNEILNGKGIVISEFFPGTQPEKWHFRTRNRIISGISKAVVIIEAGEISGALITANLANTQGREVFALPGRVDSTASAGTNQLIKDGAHLACNYKEVLNA